MPYKYLAIGPKSENVISSTWYQKEITFISSKESGDDDVFGAKVLTRRPLAWLKNKYQKLFSDHDKLHYKSLSAKGKQMHLMGAPSARPQPSDIRCHFLADGCAEQMDTSMED